jgi:hypothetical protein
MRRTDEGRNEILEINTDVTGRKSIERVLQEKNDSRERANAKFQFQSEYGCGSRFTLLIPRN